ncbi:MAG: tetratricopeptide repeat protein [Candidatus Promineifilaceae bacterium]
MFDSKHADQTRIASKQITVHCWKRSSALLVALLLIGGWLFAVPSVSAQEPAVDRDTFEVANRLYENGNYQEAAALYQQLADVGYEDSRLDYNLGNAYYESADFGRAILYYRRAMVDRPRDGALRHNLQIARTKVIDQLKPSEESLLEQITQIGNWMTLNETAGLTLSVWLAIGIAFILYRRSPNERRRTAMQSSLILLVLAFTFMLILLGSRVNRARTHAPAVVVAEEVEVVDEPSSAALAVFKLHSGAEVSVVDRQTNWYLLTLPGDELQGWISADSLTLISE